MNKVLSVCVIQKKYFLNRAKSSISDKPFFKITTAVWGNGFIAYDKAKEPYFLNVPDDVSEIKGEFYRDKSPKLSVTPNGDITFSTQIVEGGLPEGQIFDFSAIYLLDDSGDIVVVLCLLPTWMSAQRGLEIIGAIELDEY